MATILRLSNELLKNILDYVESDPQAGIPFDRRNYLSVESFKPPDPPTPSERQDIGNFRLCCRRFGELGIPYQFTRLSLRFSTAGFRRLDEIASHHHLTRHTKKFSYLVTPFFVGGEHFWEQGLRTDVAEQVERKVKEQAMLLSTNEDERVLGKAMKAFTTLQHVQLLRLIEPLPPLVYIPLEWAPACSRATKKLSEAVIRGRSPFCRFSGPMMEPHTAQIVHDGKLTLLVSRLKCLELQFDGGPELAGRMRELSGLAHTVLQAAKNLQAIHIGFPSRYPLDLRLDAIFHSIHWHDLRAFGIQAWRLDAEEIIQLVMRHRHTLRGLRLRDVQLKQGSMWSSVLAVLRMEMLQLDWVSLRRIDYADHFDELWANSMEVPDDLSDDSSISSSLGSSSGGSSSHNVPSLTASSPLHNHHSYNDDSMRSSDSEHDGLDFAHSHDETSSDSDETSSEDEDTNTDHGPEANDIAIFQHSGNPSPDTPNTLSFCTCSQSSSSGSGCHHLPELGGSAATELGDNGVSVSYQQRKMWERWVVGKCPEHA